MAKFVHDSKTKRWVIVVPSRINRPHDNDPIPSDKSFHSQTPAKCPFCPGAEKLNTEVFRIGGEPGDTHWRILVMANKYPITDYHEVIVHSPNHDHGLADLPLSQVELILQVYRQRFLYHTQAHHGQVMIFNNHDVHAGASIKHPHSQVVVVPNNISLEILPKEPIKNIVKATDHFTLYCPEFSQWPYELWIAPKKLGYNFGHISDEEITDLAPLLQNSLAFIIKKFSQPGAMHQAGSDNDVPFNFYISHDDDWYIRIIPRLIHRAGFELGTGLSVNVVDPATAAEEYKVGLQ